MSTTSTGTTVIVDEGYDRLGKRVQQLLHKRGLQTLRVAADKLSSCRIEVNAGHATCNGQSVATVLFHARPDSHFSDDFVELDRAFSSNESRAVWLALLQLPSINSVNCLDAEVWYSSAEWAVWRRRLESAGVPLAEIVVGDSEPRNHWSWLPWGGGVIRSPGHLIRRTFAPAMVLTQDFKCSLWCYGEVVNGPMSRGVHAAAEVLRSYDVQLAMIMTDAFGRVISCTTHCQIPNAVVERVAKHIAEVFGAYLYCR